MANTNYNGLSQWKGRIGGLVFKIVNGKQVIAPYKNDTFNPRTTAQMMHRAKFALAGTISKIVPKEALLGMSTDRRRRRPLFVSNIVRHAQVTVSDLGYTASLKAEDLVFSEGAYSPVTISEVSASDGVVSGILSGIDESVNAVMVIAVVYDTNIGLYTHTEYDVLSASDGFFSLNTKITDAGNVAHLYAVPMSLTQLGLSLSGGSDGAERSLSNGYAFTLMMSTNEGAYNYGHSQYLSYVSLGEDTSGTSTSGGNTGGNSGGNTGGNSGNGGTTGGGDNTGGNNGGSSQTETVTAPTISGTTPFEETTQVTITGPAESEIRYTTDGSTPTAESSLYSSALTLSDTTVVKAIAIKNGVSSTVASQTFTKGEDDDGDIN
jgi:hypothetical protein